MKTWKIVGIAGLMLASLLWSGAAQARRFNHQPSFGGCQNQVNNPHYGYHHNRHWTAERERGRFSHERDRHRHNHHQWQRQHNRMARASHWW